MHLHFDDDGLSLKRFERMLKTNSVFFFDSAEFERIIIYYIDNGKTGLAKKAIELALEQHPDNVDLRIFKAELFILEEKFVEAQHLLDELELIEPQNEEIYIQKASLYSKQHKHSEAIELLELALEITENEDNIDILHLIGMEYLFLEDFSNALNYFKECILQDPEDQSTLHNIVYCFDMLNESENAVQFLLQHIENQPYSETAWHQLGKEYYNLEKYSDALKAFDFAILIDDFFIGAYIEKAKTLEHLGYFMEAIHNYNLSNELDDPSAYSYLRIGVCYEQLNYLDQAIENYKKSSEQDPYLDKPILSIVDIYFRKKEFNKALFYINQLINLDDENVDYWKLYAHANMKIAFFEEAIKAYKKCISFNDHNLDVYLELSDALYFTGDLKESLITLIQAEVYFHNNAAIQFRLSGLHFLLNSNELGTKYLADAMKNNYKLYSEFHRLFPIVHNNKGFKLIFEQISKSINQ